MHSARMSPAPSRFVELRILGSGLNLYGTGHYDMQWRHSCTHGWYPTICPSFIVNSMEEEKNGQCGAYLLFLLSAPSFGDVLKLHLRWVSLEEDGGGNALVMRLRRWKKES